MIFQILQNGLSFLQNVILLTVMTAVILGSITVHELAHGYVSYLQGDPTAKNEGRLTLNPLKHLDKIGTVCMLFCGFGWAKPVPIDPRYYKSPKKQTALTAAAGPAVNLFIGVSATVQLTVLAWLWETGLYVAVPIVKHMTASAYEVITLSAYIVLYYNVLQTVFNLLPVPPLDGSRILFALLPDKYYYSVIRYEKLIILVMFFLLWTGIFTGVFEFVVDFIITVVGNAVLFVLNLFYELLSLGTKI